MHHHQSVLIMLAECDIPAGSEVLHSYGDLSDAALLQTYGFVDGQPSGDAEGGSSSQAEPFVNPANHVLVPFQSVLAVCRLISSQQDEDEEAEGVSFSSMRLNSPLWSEQCAALDLDLEVRLNSQFTQTR